MKIMRFIFPVVLIVIFPVFHADAEDFYMHDSGTDTKDPSENAQLYGGFDGELFIKGTLLTPACSLSTNEIDISTSNNDAIKIFFSGCSIYPTVNHANEIIKLLHSIKLVSETENEILSKDNNNTLLSDQVSLNRLEMCDEDVKSVYFHLHTFLTYRDKSSIITLFLEYK